MRYVVLLVLFVLIGTSSACVCNQTALSCGDPGAMFAATSTELFNDCVSYDLCAEAFYQTPIQDQNLFESLLTQVTPGFDARADAIEPLLCEPCDAKALETRAVTFYLSFLVQTARCAPGEVPIFDSNSGTFSCQCSPEHECHPQNVSVFALVVVLVAAALIVVAYTINRARSTSTKL
jgi:hypothetical protein